MLPVIPDAGVKPLNVNTLEATLAVCAESAGEPAPEPLIAVSWTRIVEPTSPARSV